MTLKEQLKKKANRIYEQYRKLPAGPEREKLWKKERDLLHEMHGHE